jgi:hypothetical protein
MSCLQVSSSYTFSFDEGRGAGTKSERRVPGGLSGVPEMNGAATIAAEVMAQRKRGSSAVGRLVYGLFQADDHGVGAGEMLDAGPAETGFAHPLLAVGAGEIESAGGLDQHV